MITVLDAHHRIEDECFWLGLRERGSADAAALVHEMLAHHAGIERLSAAITAETQAWRTSATRDRGEVLTQAARQLLVVVNAHMLLEEERAVPLIERHVTAAEWQDARAKGSAMLTPDALIRVKSMMMSEFGASAGAPDRV
jgi:hemerythrin-like domain-containing protein